MKEDGEMYNGYFNNGYNVTPTKQDNLNMINEQINRLEQMKTQLNQQPNTQQHQPSINQTFQLAPTSQNNMRFVNTMDDVSKEIVFFDTPFFSKDMTVMWVKNTKNEIKTYELNEIVAKDEKDLMIESLKLQLDEMNKTLKEMKDSAKPIITDDDEPVEESKPSNVSISRTSKTKSK